MGEKPSSGFDVEIEKATIETNKIELSLKEIEPKKRSYGFRCINSTVCVYNCAKRKRNYPKLKEPLLLTALLI